MTNALEFPAAQPLSKPRSVVILGSTGSVGCQTIDLIEREPQAYQVLALTAHRNVAKLAEQAKALRAKQAVIADETLYDELKTVLQGSGIEAMAGAQAVVEVAAQDSDWLMSAIVGSAGLPPTLAAARRGGTIAFANKETLVCAGDLMMRLVREAGATLLPVDSEHNAIWQVFDFDRPEAIEKLILTASGGPFRSATRDYMAKVTPAEAIKHPVWSMGAKISIDSATLMNKALEVIEAHHLFQMPREKIEVVVHPQSVIHSMVEYKDGSVLAQLGSPDMRIPIAYTLAWPQRMATPAARLDLAKLGSLTFEAPDAVKFPALNFAQEAMRIGGTAAACLNAANEMAVQAFLDQRIGFLDIEKLNEAALTQMNHGPLTDLEMLRQADEAARKLTAERIAAL